MKANKGEWCEFYAFLKILDEKKLHAADKNLEIIKDKFFVFQKVVREDISFDISGKTIIILNSAGEVIKNVDDLDCLANWLKSLKRLNLQKAQLLKLRKRKR